MACHKYGTLYNYYIFNIAKKTKIYLYEKTKIRIGVIGIGYLGKFHLEKFQKNKDCQLVWLIDKNIKNLKNYKDKYNVSTNYKEIVNDVDAVSIVTPTVNHYEIARYFIERNKHVLIEKPMTQTVSEAKKLINLAKNIKDYTDRSFRKVQSGNQKSLEFDKKSAIYRSS